MCTILKKREFIRISQKTPTMNVIFGKVSEMSKLNATVVRARVRDVPIRPPISEGGMKNTVALIVTMIVQGNATLLI